jgi:predicted membrane protein
MRHRYRHPRHNASQRLILGGFIVLIGVLSLIDNLGIFNTAQILEFWPTVFIVLGVIRISQARGASGFFFGSALLLAGGLLTAESMGYLHISWQQWWPAFIIVAGISYILKGVNQRPSSGDVNGLPGDPCQATTLPSSADTIEIFAVMSGSKVSNPSAAFKGGEVTAIMGSAEIDLRSASIQGEAVIQVTAVMGSIEIMVPNDWVVILTGVPILGGIEDHTVPPKESTKRLVISGAAVMGGVEIRN